MTTVTRSRPGHWADQHARFMGLTDGDQRVSLDQQQDHMPANPARKPSDTAIVVGLLLSPFIVIALVSIAFH